MSDPPVQYRAELDFEITFSNGGGLHGEGFRIDVEDPGLTKTGLGTALIADLGLLLGAGVPVCEHLTNPGVLPGSGFRFSAVPPRVSGFGTFPVRACATWEEPP